MSSSKDEDFKKISENDTNAQVLRILRRRDQYKSAKSYLEYSGLGFHRWKAERFRRGLYTPKFTGNPVDLTPDQN